MAHSTFAAPIPFGTHIRNFAGSVGTFFAALNHAIMVNSTAYQRLQQVERLQAKSDAELEKLGIPRGGIVQYAFRGFF